MDLGNVKVLTHSAIRIQEEKIFYFDPYDLASAPHDADAVLVTHDHYDHYSPDDLAKVANGNTVIVAPESCVEQVREDFPRNEVVSCAPGQNFPVCGVPVEAVAAYNPHKNFHPQQNGWVGYVVTLGGSRYFVTGDCDAEPQNEAVLCDVVLVPVGGTYTFDPGEAAEFVNGLHPKAAIPTHYGTVVGTAQDARTFADAVDPAIQVELKMGQE